MFVYDISQALKALVRSAFESSMEALQQPTIRVVAVIAEGVPEADTKKLIAYAREHNKILLGPATVGGIQVPLPLPSMRGCALHGTSSNPLSHPCEWRL